MTILDISANGLNLNDFIASLGSVLTSTDIDVRVNAMNLLSSTLTKLPNNYLSAAQLEFISTFYCDRFKDHHSVLPNTLSGAETLVKMTNLTDECITRLLQAIFQNVSCQSQLRPDRLKIYNIIIESSNSQFQGEPFEFNALNNNNNNNELLCIYFNFQPC